MEMTPWEGSRYLRLTFKVEGGKRQRFAGEWSWQGNRLVGRRQTGPIEATTLYLVYADPLDVLKIERQHPIYEEWGE